MSARRESVPISPGGSLRVTARSGKVEVVGEARADVLVEKGSTAHVTDHGDVAVERGSGAIQVRCPEGVSVLIGSDSGRVRIRGRVGSCRVTTRSGSIEVERAADVDARTDSGSITVADSAGSCRCHTGSGNLKVERSPDADLVSGSGNVTARVATRARVRAGSGNVTLDLDDVGDVDIEVHSGNARVAVPHDSRPALDLEVGSGTVRSSVASGVDGRVRVRAGSGTITVEAR